MAVFTHNTDFDLRLSPTLQLCPYPLGVAVRPDPLPPGLQLERCTRLAGLPSRDQAWRDQSIVGFPMLKAGVLVVHSRSVIRSGKSTFIAAESSRTFSFRRRQRWCVHHDLEARTGSGRWQLAEHAAERRRFGSARGQRVGAVQPLRQYEGQRSTSVPPRRPPVPPSRFTVDCNPAIADAFGTPRATNGAVHGVVDRNRTAETPFSTTKARSAS